MRVSVVGLREQTALLRQERLEQLRRSSSGSKGPSTRPRGGDIREQRPDAALDVLSAGTAHAREEQRDSTATGSTRHADRSISLGMSVSRGAR